MEMNEVERYKRFLLRSQTGRGEWEQGYVFQGRRAQRGFGFGGFLRGMVKSVLPSVKKIARQTLKKARRAGIGMASDFLGGKNFQESLRSRGGDFARDVLSDAQAELQGRRTRRKRRRADITEEPRPRLRRKKRRLDTWESQEPWSTQSTRMRY